MRIDLRRRHADPVNTAINGQDGEIVEICLGYIINNEQSSDRNTNNLCRKASGALFVSGSRLGS